MDMQCSLAPSESGVFQTAAGTIAYRLSGRGRPLCLVTTLAGTWSAQVRSLQERFTVLTYDMRGYGSSTSLSGFPTNEEHADDLAHILAHLRFYDPIIVGLSHGGIVAQIFAACHPTNLVSLVLVSTLARASGGTRLLLQMLDGFLATGRKEEFWEILRSFLVSEKNYAKIMRRETAVRNAMFEAYTAEGLHSIYAAALRHDGPSMLHRIRVPTLVIGGAEDMLFPPRITAELAGLIPGAALAYLPAAHVPPVEVPDEFRSTLVAFTTRSDMEGTPQK